MGPGVLIGITEGQLVSNRILLQEAKSVTNSDIVICARKKAGTIEVRSDHDEEVGACIGGIGLRTCLGNLRLGTSGA